MKKALLLLIIFLSVSDFYPQGKTNLELVYDLIGKSVQFADSVRKNNNSVNVVSLSLPQAYDQLKTEIIKSFSSYGYKIASDEKATGTVFIYSLVECKTEYGEIFKDGFFGDNLVERKASLKGSLILQDGNFYKEPVEFSFYQKDTLSVDEAYAAQNNAMPFTQGSLPDAPILSNLLEPAIVVGTLIVTVILFFTVRSK